ncbi:MAG: sugar ABC transporter permease [Actinomycetota bacterium]
MTTIFTGPDDHTTTGSGSRDDGGHGTLERRERRWGLLFVTPWLLGLVLLFITPLVLSLLMSFTNYELIDTDDQEIAWVGFDNWQRVFSDPEVGNGLWVTLKFALMFVPVSTLLPLSVAYLLTSERLWGRGVFRLLFYLPSMVPLVAAMIIWRFYLNAESGWFARLLRWFGLNPPNFLGDADWVLPALVLIGTWGIGNAVIIFIAALNGVPTELYEAARIDGAGKWRLFRDVTWPMISPITFYNVIITLVGLGQYFLVPFILQGVDGRPEGASRFYTMVFYQETFSFFQAGYGAALAWAMFIVVFTLTALLFWSAKFWVHYEFEER